MNIVICRATFVLFCGQNKINETAYLQNIGNSVYSSGDNRGVAADNAHCAFSAGGSVFCRRRAADTILYQLQWAFEKISGVLSGHTTVETLRKSLYTVRVMVFAGNFHLSACR